MILAALGRIEASTGWKRPGGSSLTPLTGMIRNAPNGELRPSDGAISATTDSSGAVVCSGRLGMPEGALIAGTVAEATFDNPRVKPPDDANAAPWGWTWDTKARRWRPRKSAGRAGAKARAGGPRQKASSEPEIPQPSLDDFDEDGEPNGDPDPAWFRENASRGSSPGKGRFRLEDVPKQVKDDLAGVLGFAGTMLLPVVESIDPYCGRAVSENYARIVDACVPLMCRSERVIKFMTSTGGGFMDYVALGLALAPVGKAIADHHIFRTVDVVRDEVGQVHVVRRERGTQHAGDHLTPPQPQMQYAA